MDKILRIYRSGELIHEFIPENGFGHHKALMGDNYINCTLLTKDVLNISVFDYIESEGEKYTLYDDLDLTHSDGIRSYPVNFYGEYYKLNFVPVEHEGATAFDYFGDSHLVANLIISSLKKFGYNEFSLGIIEDSESVSIRFENEHCLQGLTAFCEATKMEWEFSGTVLNIRKRVGVDTSYTFEYGKGKGAYSVSRQKISNSDVYTQIIVKGGTDNIPKEYDSADNPKRLNLHGLILKNNVDKYGSRIGIFENDEIFPRLIGKKVLSVEVPADIQNATVWKLKLDIPFNLSDYYAPDSKPEVKFRTGDLTGISFEIAENSWNNIDKTLQIIVQDQDGYILPSTNRQPRIGDEFVLLGILMPPTYVTEAEEELKEWGNKKIKEVSEPQFSYGLTVDPSEMKKNDVNLNPGDSIVIADGDNKSSIRILEIIYPFYNKYNATFSLGNNILYSYEEKVRNDLNDITNEVHNLKRNVQNVDRRGWRDAKEVNERLEGIEEASALFGTEGGQLTSSLRFEANIGSNPNKFGVTEGRLQHFIYKENPENGIWNIGAFNITLEEDVLYSIYAKCDKSSTNGSIYISKEKIDIESIPGYYMFFLGTISSIFEGARTINTVTGYTLITGGYLTGQILQDAQKRLVIDMTNATITAKSGALIRGKVQIESLEGEYKDIEVVADEIAKESGSEAAKEQINGLEIGGRNLLANSDFSWPDISMYKLPSDSIYTITRENDMLKIIGASAGNDGASDKRITVYTLKPNEDGDYTISFDAYALTPVTLYYRFGYFAEKENIAIIDIGTIKRRYSGTFKGGKYNDVYNASFMWFSGATTIYIDNIQLEKGNKATAYKLAPEDQEQRAVDSIEIGSVNLISKKMMLEWAKINKETIYWYQSSSNEKPFLKINNSALYNYIGGKEEFKDIFDGKIKYKTNTQYVFSVEWNIDAVQNYEGLIFQIYYTSGGVDHLRLAKDQTSVVRQDLITRKNDTISKIAITFGTNIQLTNIYNISLIEGNKIVSGFPVAPEDITGTNNINLANDTKTATIPATSDMHHFAKFFVRNIKPNTVYYVNFGNIENLAGNPSLYTVLLYDKTTTKLLSYNLAYNFNKNGGILTTTHDIEEQEGYLLCYAGIKAGTAGNSVKFTEIMLVEGDQPATVWTPSIDETEEKARIATGKLTDWASDSMISPTEKTGLKQQQNEIKEEYIGFNTQVSDLSLTSNSAWTNYKNAYNSAIAALTKYTAPTPESIQIESDYANIAAYYKQKEQLLLWISDSKTNYRREWPVIDTTQLDINTYYPVVMRIINYRRAILKLKAKWGDSTPSWSTHDRKYFSAEMTWEANANGWGVALENRYVTSFEFRWANSSPIGWGPIKQMTFSSHEVIHVRGGAKYTLITENVDIVSLKTTSFTVSGQTVSPQTSITTPVVDVDIAKSTAEEAKVQADSQAYLKEAFQNKTTLQAGLVSTTLIKLGAVNSSGNWIEKAGINGSITNRGANDIRFYAGGDLASAIRLVDNISGTKATFAVTEGGKLIATNVEITGKIIATSGEFTGKIQSSVNGDRFIINPADKSFKMFAANNDELSNLSFLTMTGVDDGNDANFASIVLYNRIRAQLLSQPKKTELTAWGFNLYNNYEGSIIDNTGMLAHFGRNGIMNKYIGARSGSGWTTLYYNKTTGEIAY